MLLNHHNRTTCDRRTARTDRRQRGASVVEYALMLALVAVACIAAVSYFGSSNETGLNKSKDCFSAAYDGQAIPAKC